MNILFDSNTLYSIALILAIILRAGLFFILIEKKDILKQQIQVHSAIIGFVLLSFIWSAIENSIAFSKALDGYIFIDSLLIRQKFAECTSALASLIILACISHHKTVK